MFVAFYYYTQPKGTQMTDPRVTAIRADKRFGRGSCSFIDECYSDSELLARLDENNITSVKDALAWAEDYVEMYESYAADIRATAW